MSATAVFFVADAPSALEFYTTTLGFRRDWVHEEQGRPFVFRVSLLDFEIILNQCEPDTKHRVGHGRVFIGLDAHQSAGFRAHIEKLRIPLVQTHWGAPTLVMHDMDRNEFFFWLPETERASLPDVVG